MDKLIEENEELKYQINKLTRRIDRKERIGTEILRLKKEMKKLFDENKLLKHQLELVEKKS